MMNWRVLGMGFFLVILWILDIVFGITPQACSMGLEVPIAPHGALIPLPCWIFTVPVFLLTFYLWLKARAFKEPGRCEYCDYDLMGNVSGRCPECGNTIDSEKERGEDAAEYLDALSKQTGKKTENEP